MKYIRCVGLVAIALACRPLLSQERESPVATAFDKVGRAVLTTFERPLRPVISSLAPGGGIGAGVAYQSPWRGPWSLESNASATTRAFTNAYAGGAYDTERLSIATYAQLSDAPRLEYFGPGIESDERDRSSYAQRDATVGLYTALRASRWLAVAARFESLAPEIARGRSRSLPDVHDTFTEADAAGLTRQPRFNRYATDVYVIVPAAHAEALNQGGQLRVGFSVYDDREFNEHSFRRLEVAASHSLAVAGALRRLQLSAMLSTTRAAAGHRVPFYMQSTLGGHAPLPLAPYRNIVANEPAATLRGYRNQRFRDNNVLLLQLEYRHSLWGPLDLALFADAGQVARRAYDLALRQLKSDAGAGFVLLRGMDTAIRADVAFGNEGVRLLLRVGNTLLP